MSSCICKTGPKGLGPRCTKKPIPGNKFCTLHSKKCLIQAPETPQARQLKQVPQARQLKQSPQAAQKKEIKGKNCVVQTQKKYTTRPSPAYPANECCGEIMLGNNGRLWKSISNVKGVCAWKEINKLRLERN